MCRRRARIFLCGYGIRRCVDFAAGGEFDVSLVQNSHLARQQTLPSFDAQGIGRHDHAVVDRLGLQIYGNRRIAEGLACTNVPP